MRRVAVNYTTFARDREWMDYSLASFRKYATGFSGVTIVVPTVDIDAFLPLEAKYSTPECPVKILNFLEYPGKGFVHHLAMKCYADVFQPDATHILHMDPDTLFSAHVTPGDYFVNDKPVMLIEPYTEVQKYHTGRFNWQVVTEIALRFPCPYETMCRHPAVHKRETYLKTRDHIEAIHRTPFLDFVLKQKNSFPQGFGEFNTLGAYAYEKMRDEYHFWDRGDTRDSRDPKQFVEQMWSYTGVNAQDNRAKIDRILK